MIEIPECPICLEAYDLGERAPMILPCGHTVCLADLQQLAHNAEGTGLPPRCPSCKARFAYRPNHHHHAEQGEAGIGINLNGGGSGGVSRNYALQEMLETALRLTGGVPPQAIPRCATHPMGLLELWCEDCGMGVCPKCFLERHRGHDMKGLDEAFQGRGSRELDEALDLGERALRQAQARAECVRDRRARLLAAHEGIKSEITRYFDLVIAEAQRRRIEMLAEADRVWEDKVHRRCEAEEAAAATQQADVNKRLQELRTLQEKGYFLALMDAAPQARRAFKEALLLPRASSEAVARLPSSLELHWGDWPLNRLCETITKSGTIEAQRPPYDEDRPHGSHSALRDAEMEGGVAPSAGYITARGAGLWEAVLGQTASFVLTAYGPDGRRWARGGEDDFVVTIREGFDNEDSPRHAIMPTVRDRRDGTYEVTYMPSLGEPFDEESLSGAQPPQASPSALLVTGQSNAGAAGLQLGSTVCGGSVFDPEEPHYLKVTISGNRRPSSSHSALSDGAVARHVRRQGSVVEEAIEEESLSGVVVVDKCGPTTVVGGPSFHVRVHPPFLGVPVGTLGRKGAQPGCFDGPGSLAVDGNWLWVADGDRHRVQQLDLSRGGRVYAVHGRGSEGVTFRSPYGVAVDESFVYVSERDAGCVSVLDKNSGKRVRVLGQDARMRDPLAVGVNAALVGVTDSSNSRVVFLDKRTGKVAHVLGPALPPEAGGGSLACPCDVVFDELDDSVYVSDREASRILVFDTRTWAFRRQIGSHGVGPGEFTHVNRLCIAGERIYASDRFGRRVLAFNKHTGDPLLAFGVTDPATGERLLDRPNGVAVYGSKVLCADYSQSLIHVFA